MQWATPAVVTVAIAGFELAQPTPRGIGCVVPFA
jgi:hypothetical protein